MLARVRLRFQSTPIHYAQKCWFTFDKEQCRLVGDVAHLIGSQFGFDLHKDGIQVLNQPCNSHSVYNFAALHG